jgi:hypothetical protein
VTLLTDLIEFLVAGRMEQVEKKGAAPKNEEFMDESWCCQSEGGG